MKLKVIGYWGVLTVFWVVFNEDVSLIQWLVGGVISASALLLSYGFLSSNRYVSGCHINIIQLLGYLFYLLILIFISSISTIKAIIIKKESVFVMEYQTKLQHPLASVLLANSITLTPGTISISYQGNMLKILCLQTSEKQVIKQEIIKMENKIEKCIIPKSKKEKFNV